VTQVRAEHIGPVRLAVPLELVIGAEVGWVEVGWWRIGRIVALDRFGDPIVWRDKGDQLPTPVMSVPWDRIWTLQRDRRG
jgi:hypothetical protein